MNDQNVTLDVREDLRSGREPFTKIMTAAAALRRGGNLLIIAPFQPVPLLGVLKKLGFSYTANKTDSGDWKVLFTRQTETAASEVASPHPASSGLPKFLSRLRKSREEASHAQPSPSQEAGVEQWATPGGLAGQTQAGCNRESTAPIVLEVDARGLEPPQPMVKILEALTGLPNGAEIKAHTDRRPMHLYAQLEERGFRGETTEQPDGSFVTYVRRG